MYARRDFDPADPGEDEQYFLDFSRDLVAGDTIASTVWSCEVAVSSKVDDASAASRLVGSPTDAAQQTSHRVVNLQAGVKYMLRAVATTSLGHTVSLWSYVQCMEPA